MGECLESILEEINRNPNISCEIIVVNNASTDNTKKVALAFSNVYPVREPMATLDYNRFSKSLTPTPPPTSSVAFSNGVKVVDEDKKGIVFARAAGARVASGDLLAHIDADCRLPQGWLKTAAEQFAKDKKLVALSGPHIYYELSQLQKLEVKIFYFLTYFFYFLNRYILHIGSFMQGGNFVVTAAAWKKIGQAGPKISFYGEDTDLCMRLYKVGRVKFTFKLPIYTSARRMAEEGLVTIGARYALNYFSVIFFKKPATKTYKDIRPG